MIQWWSEVSSGVNIRPAWSACAGTAQNRSPVCLKIIQVIQARNSALLPTEPSKYANPAPNGCIHPVVPNAISLSPESQSWNHCAAESEVLLPDPEADSEPSSDPDPKAVVSIRALQVARWDGLLSRFGKSEGPRAVLRRPRPPGRPNVAITTAIPPNPCRCGQIESTLQHAGGTMCEGATVLGIGSCNRELACEKWMLILRRL